jgi:hypothetical protein
LKSTHRSDTRRFNVWKSVKCWRLGSARRCHDTQHRKSIKTKANERGRESKGEIGWEWVSQRERNRNSNNKSHLLLTNPEMGSMFNIMIIQINTIYLLRKMSTWLNIIFCWCAVSWIQEAKRDGYHYHGKHELDMCCF